MGALVSRGFGAGWVVLGSTGAGMLADGVIAGEGEGASAGACAVVDGAAGAGVAVVVTGCVGTMAPVGLTGSRDTTRTADTAMPTATTAMAPSVTTAETVPNQGSAAGSPVRPVKS
ncbi:MAG TPA: hypothetical protein VHU62_01450 [Mycobacterium sp.]|nr:hypothetical protein [Mycobacterium sp.]